MPIDFPSNPSVDQTYSFDNYTWQWTGSVWNLVGGTAGIGNVLGTSSSTDNAVTRFDGTNGTKIQNSLVTISDDGTITAPSVGSIIPFYFADQDAFPSASTYHGAIAHSDADGRMYFAHNGTWNGIANASEIGEGGGGNSFSTITVTGEGNVVADSSADTLTLTAGSGISITINEGTDSITIAATGGGGGSTTFAGLNDAVSSSLTIDQIYLPAITMLTVTNQGTSAYLFDQYSGTNPTLYAINGTTIAFNLNVGGHPFLIQDPSGTNYNTGLYHVSTTGIVSTGSSAQGQTSGTLYWKIPSTISGGYRYQCGAHAIMVGSIVIKNFVSI